MRQADSIAKFEGQWLDGQWHGKGKWTKGDGTVIKAVFENHEFKERLDTQMTLGLNMKEFVQDTEMNEEDVLDAMSIPDIALGSDSGA